jgi:hypothetical protein
MIWKMSNRSEILSGEIFESAMMAVQSGGNNLRLLAKYMIFMIHGTADVPGPLWPVRVLHGKRQTFTSFHHYLLDQPGDGIGLPSLHFLKQVLEATPQDGQRAIGMVRAELAKEHVDFDKQARLEELKLHGERPPLAEPGHPMSSSNVDNINKGTQGGTSAAYLAGVLKRDHPEISEQLAAGKFRSVRAAAKAAGIVEDPDALDQLRRWWKKASEEQRATFREEIAE